jgi:glycosyltransferase involved in cell wall biosynthesis
MTVAINTLAMRSEQYGFGRYIGAMVRELLRQEPERFLIYSARELMGAWRSQGARRVKSGPARRDPRLLWEQTVLPADLRRERVTVLWGPAQALPLWKTTRQVVTIHDLTPFTHARYLPYGRVAYFRGTLRAVARRADRVVVDSRATAGEVERMLRIDPGRIRVIPAAVGPQFQPGDGAARTAVRARYGLPEHFILSLGVIEPRKNLLRLLQAVAVLNHAGAPLPLVIAGYPRHARHQEQLRQTAARDGSAVHFLGEVPEPDLPALLGAATLLAFVSLAEGFGLPLLEAMACGTPVVASRIAALVEVGGDAALYVDPHDPGAIAAAIQSLAQDGALHQRFQHAGLERARQFSWTAAAQALRAVFDELEPAAA